VNLANRIETDFGVTERHIVLLRQIPLRANNARKTVCPKHLVLGPFIGHLPNRPQVAFGVWLIWILSAEPTLHFQCR
jgi:hypothetical protein